MRLHIVPLLAAVVFSPVAFAQPAANSLPLDPRATVSQSGTGAKAIGLSEALASALANNPDLTAARLELAATEGARQQSAASPNPTVSMDLEDTRRATRTTTVSLSQPIELGGKRTARMSAADRARDVAAAQLAAREADLKATVTVAYFDALVAQERVRVAEASLALAEGGSSAAARRVVAGKISPIEETRARVAESGVRLELQQARSEVRLALHALRVATGAAVDTFDAVSGTAIEIPPAMPAAELARRLADAPAIREARRNTERLAALADVERARRTPDVTISLGARRDAEAGRNIAVLGIAVPIPIFDTNQGAEIEALRRRDKAVAEARSITLRLELDVLQAQEQLQTGRQEVDALQRDVMPGAQAAYDAASKGFDLGKFGFLDVLDAQRTLLQAKGQYLRALANTHRNRIELDRLLGEPTNNTSADAPTQP